MHLAEYRSIGPLLCKLLKHTSSLIFLFSFLQLFLFIAAVGVLLLLLDGSQFDDDLAPSGSKQTHNFSSLNLMTMRDLSCFRDAAVTTISSATNAGGSDHLDRSLQAATACVYRAALSSRKELLVTVTWTRSLSPSITDSSAPGATGLSVAVQDVVPLTPPKLIRPSFAAVPKTTVPTTPRRPSTPTTQAQQKQQQQQQVLHLQTKRRGSRAFVTEGGTNVAVHWDTADARYPSPSCPEPCAGGGGCYYLAVVADGEPALLLGDAARRFASAAHPCPKAVLVSRREQLRAMPPPPSPSTPSPTYAAVAHSTRCRFRDGGAEHEVTVHCRGDRRAASAEEGEVAVRVDGRTVVEARRVGWNFRGNRTAVLADGAVVEVMWDVHDWWFPSATGGAAQFMVKARGGGGGGGLGVWMDEEMASKGCPPNGFFLHMQCYRR